jgi:hypothetical protein
VADVDLAASDDPSATYLVGRLQLVAERLAAVVRRGDGPVESDLDAIGDQLGELERRAEALGTTTIAARSVAESFGLSPADLDILLLSALVDLDPEARELCRAHPSNAGQPRPTVGLALDITGTPTDHVSASAHFGETAPLVRHHLVAIEGFDQPLTSRPYAVPDRVVRALWGSSQVDPLLRNLVTPLIGVPSPEAEAVARAIRTGVRTVYVRERPAASGLAFAASIIDALEVSAIAFDLRRLGADHSAYGVAAAAAREGGLRDSLVVIGPIDKLATDLEALTPLVDAPWPVVMYGSQAWEPSWSRSIPYVVEAPRVDQSSVSELWSTTLARHDTQLDPDARDVVSVLRLTPDEAVRAAVSAVLAAASDETRGPITPQHVRVAARAQSAGRLETLAERVEPRTSFDDLVLAPRLLEQVTQIAARRRHRDRVLGEWGMGGPASRGRGITALFAGDSGTGKTLSAEAIAGELGVDLYVIDLSTVVDKYIGETEKNLGRVFDEAEGINGVLFFDEADAIFGKRTETSDARDRYANVEVAYLLQRMERFDGVAILATNLRSNIDEAFTRRLDVIVHFMLPDAEHRRLLWERHLPDTLPKSDDIDIPFLAKKFDIAGGVIRNVALTAAYRAADQGEPVSMAHLLWAMNFEFTKMGRLFDSTGLGEYAAVLEQA